MMCVCVLYSAVKLYSKHIVYVVNDKGRFEVMCESEVY